MNAFRSFLSLIVALFLSLGVLAGGISNPDFQPGLKHWKTRGKVHPFDGAAHVTPSIIVPGNPNLFAATLSQAFNCSGSGNCYVKFTYEILAANDLVYVELGGGGNKVDHLLPYNNGMPQTAQVMIPGCHSDAKIEFVVFGSPGQVAFEVDQVTDDCSSQPWPNIPLLSPLSALDSTVQVVAALPLSRYSHENFDSIQYSHGVPYGQNFSVLTGTPVLETLLADVYAPANDSLLFRPLVVLAHSGDFLPTPLNRRTSGSRQDSSIVRIATRLSQRGYVVAAIDYRLGWSALSASQSDRTETFLRVLYQGIQDVRTAMRYFKKEAGVWGIDTNRVAIGGLGTGGYLAYGAASLDQFSEMAAVSNLDSSLWGNIWATNSRPLCVANHLGHGSMPQMAFAAGGALPSLSWMEAGEPPLVGLHSVQDYWVPYGSGALVVPTSGDFVLNVEGTGQVVPASHALGNQDLWIGKDLSGPFTDRANAIHGGVEGLFPFESNGPLTEPWEWWDSTHVHHHYCLGFNPQMSPEHAANYIDTIIYYLSPRMICALDLNECQDVLTTVVSQVPTQEMTVYPNPAAGNLLIKTKGGEIVQEVRLCQLDGKEWIWEKDIDQGQWVLERRNWPAGVYLLTVRTNKGTLARKLVYLPVK